MLFSSCSNDEITENNLPAIPDEITETTILADSIFLNKSLVNLMVGQNEQITYTFQPTNANEPISWFSYNPEIAVVNNMGLITAISPGRAKIKAIVGGRYDSFIQVLVSTATTTGAISGSWQNLNNLPSDCARYGSVNFVIGNKGYIGLGSNIAYIFSYGNVSNLSGQNFSSFKSYDFTSNQWSSIASIPFGESTTSLAFSINDKAYVGLGGLGNNFWQYDSNSNTWTQLPNFPGLNRENAVSFSVNGKGYVGLGNQINNMVSDLNDFWEFDPATNTWIQLSDFPGGSRRAATAFTIDNKAYVGLGARNNGINGSTVLSDVWSFNANSNTWTQKANMPIAPDLIHSWAITGRFSAKAFSINGKGYVGNGYSVRLLPDFEYYSFKKTTDFWEYNPINDSWILKPYSPNISDDTFVFSNSNAGFIGGGKNVTDVPYTTTVAVNNAFHKLIL